MGRVTAVNIRELARSVGYSPITVSRALKDDRRVRRETRERILAAARAAGYRPNPMVSSLMAHIRGAGGRRPGVNLAWLAGDAGAAPWTRDPHRAGYYAGARERAGELGFGLDIIATESGAAPQRAARILDSRGIAGVVYPPGYWRDNTVPHTDYAAVILGGWYLGERLHRVFSDYTVNLSTAFHHLLGHGLRRIGLFCSRAHLVESQGNTYAAFMFNQRLLDAKDHLPPVVVKRAAGPPRRAFERWCAAHRPDAVLTDFDEMETWCAAGRGSAGPRPVHLDLCGEPAGRWGMDCRHRVQGRVAIDLLARQVYHNERAVPAFQEKVLIPGVWAGPAPRGSADEAAFLRPEWYDQWVPAPEDPGWPM